MLEANGDEYAFQFIRQKISDIEITPAQLALDPCSAGCVVTDVKTGEVRALVTYPSYDNNKFSGTVDAEYYNKLNNDMSRCSTMRPRPRKPRAPRLSPSWPWPPWRKRPSVFLKQSTVQVCTRRSPPI